LISRYVITIIPVILGKGIPLFAPGSSQDSLALLTSKPFKSGIVQLTYKNA